jgi:FemAB-related protein (PEP-CTERM system-associated)
MKVRLAKPDDYPEIEEFITNASSSSLYHRVQWVDVVERSFGHPCYYLLSEKDEAITGVLPLVHLKSRIFGNMLVSMPYFNYGGVCAEEEWIENNLIDKAIEIAKSVGAGHLELRQERRLNNGLAVKYSKVSMRLDLPTNPEELWKSFPSKLRSQVKIPQKAGMIVRMGGLEEIDGFYEVFTINMRALGTPVLPKAFFKNILEIFPGSTRICTVYLENVPVASGFLAGFKGMLEIPWASSIRKYNRSSPNMLLYWTCLKFGCENGYRVFDFGRSTAGESTFRFKEQWGASPHPLYWHYWTRKDLPVPDISPHNPKYQLAINLWKKLPLPVTRYLGPLIVKNIP